LLQVDRVVDEDIEKVIIEKIKQEIERMKQEQQVPGGAQPSGNLVGSLRDLQTGQFLDAAKGLLELLQVDKAWSERMKEHCSVEGMQAEVRCLYDCPDCAEAQADAFGELAPRAHNSVAAKFTRDLAEKLRSLKEARKDQNVSAIDEHRQNIAKLRKDMEESGYWVYGGSKCQVVEIEGGLSMRMKHEVDIQWKEDSVKHQYGKYGQPMCDRCKKLGLDWSTIAADLDYVLNQASSEKKCFNGTRDEGRPGMELEDFKNLREASETGLDLHEIAALRLYTSHSFPAINLSLRDRESGPHPLPGVVINISNGVKKMRKLDAAADAAVKTVTFWRGFTDTTTSQDFKERGGSEFAPMSTSKKPAVATGYAVRKSKTNEALLMKIVSKNQLQRGADVSWLSMFPGEDEVLWSPLTFMQPTGREQVIEHDGFKVNINEVECVLGDA